MNIGSPIILVCYSFPPNPGVGGRRWVKFAKHLAGKGFQPIIVAKLPSGKDHSPWEQDVKGLKTEYINYHYPSSLDTYPETLFDKLKYRLSLFYVKFFAGNYYDRSIFSEQILVKTLSGLIKKYDVKCIIITAPPFRHTFFIQNLKKQFNNLKIYVDLRDPWTDNSTFMAFDSLSVKRLQYEKNIEKNVIENADKVICVNKYYAEILKAKYLQQAENIVHLPNGFDEEDIKGEGIAATIDLEEIAIVCAGTVYNATEYLFLPFLNFVNSNKELLKRGKVKFKFYGNIDTTIQLLVKKSHNELFEFNPIIGSQQLHDIIRNSRALMMFIAPNHADNFNTKFYEYLAHRKPILLFSNKGDISKFIEQSKLGYTIDTVNFDQKLKHVLDEMISGKTNINYNFDLREFNVSHLTDNLLKIISND